MEIIVVAGYIIGFVILYYVVKEAVKNGINESKLFADKNDESGDEK